MKIEELIEGVSVENETTEFKKTIRGNSEEEAVNWLKEISAFSNSSGGVIYVGVDDKDHSLHPLPPKEFDKTANLVYSSIKSRIEPEISVNIKEIPVPAEEISYLMKIEVPKYGLSPVFLHYEGIPVAFIRKFGRSEACNAEMLADLFYNSSSARYDDKQTSIKFEAGSLNSYGKAYEEANGEKLSFSALYSCGMVNKDGFFSKGGWLFSDNCKSEKTLLRMSQYAGEDKGGDLVVYEEDFVGPIHECIKKGSEFVKYRSVSGYRKTNEGRVNLSSYPGRSVIEALANAYAHRNYFIDGSQIMLDLFPDRLEITSPGSLSMSVSYRNKKDLSAILPYRRNPIICDALRYINLMEGKGSGFRKIEKDYLDADENHRPFIDSDRDYFRITLPDLTFAPGLIREMEVPPEIDILEGGVSPHDKSILSFCYLREKGIAEIASSCGVAPSTYFKTNSIKPLVEKGLLSVSKKKNAYVYRTNREAVPIKR